MQTRLNEILSSIGEAGLRLDHMKAVEASAGNISVHTDEKLELSQAFDSVENNVALPVSAPALVGKTVFVTGSGCRLRDVARAPQNYVAAYVINEDAKTATCWYSKYGEFKRPTSEFNSHLAVHNSQAEERSVHFQAVIHAQPPYIVALSHINAMRNNEDFNRAILRWEPETIVQIPQGVEVLEYMVPGSSELMESNVRGLSRKIMTIWSRHGIMVRSDESALGAVDKVEYAETGAMYEYLNRTMGSPSEGLSIEDLRKIVSAFNVETDLF